MKIIKTKKYSQVVQNSLDGKSNQSARNFIYKLVHEYTTGIYSDSYWQPVQEIWKKFTENNINWDLTGTQYKKDEKGNPNQKEWYFKIYFDNNRGKFTELNGTITAYGAGSVSNPLDRYDLTVII